MSSPLTPGRLQKKVDEWRELRMQKLAARLQIHSSKGREVSASVLGVRDEKRVHLPTPPSAKPSGANKQTSSAGLGKKSLSYGDVHNYQQQRHSTYPHDYRNGGGMSRQEPRSPYGYPQGQGHYPHHQQQHHPRSPHYNPHDYRNQNTQRSGPSGYRNSYAPAGGSGYRSHPHSSNYNRNNSKGGAVRKTNDQPNGSKPQQGYNNDSKHATPRKSVAPKEQRTVTFEDEKKEVVDLKPSEVPTALDVVPLVQSTELETKLNSTFNVEDSVNAPGDDVKPDESASVAPAVTFTEEQQLQETAQASRQQDISAVESSIIEQEIVVSTSEVDVIESSETIAVAPVSQATENIVSVPAIIISEPEERSVQVEHENLLSNNGTEKDIKENYVEVLEPEKKENENSEENDSSFKLCLEADSSTSVDEGGAACEMDEEETGEVFYPAANAVSEPESSEQQQADSTVQIQTLAEGTLTPESESQPSLQDLPQQEEAYPAPIQEDNHEDEPENQIIVPSSSETEESPLKKKQDNQTKHVDEVTENLDALYITPGRASRKSRVLVDSTNIVESSSIKYVVRETKHKEALDVVVTPVRRSTRLKKAETPGSAIKTANDLQELSPDILRKAKIVPNPFLN